MGNKIQLQQTSTTFGVLLAFFGGSIVYEYKGAQGASQMGLIFMLIEMLTCLHTLYIQETNPQLINLLPDEKFQQGEDDCDFKC